MPNAPDNQDLPDIPKTGMKESNTGAKNKDLPDENNFTSDNLKGKKVDADPEKQSEQPADV